MAFRGLQAESVAQGKVHMSISKELTELVADPFDEWARAYKVRINIVISKTQLFTPTLNQDRLGKNKHTILNNWLKTYEQAHYDVSKLKQQYLAKVRKADDAEDEYGLISYTRPK
jgi:hypothetical protein